MTANTPPRAPGTPPDPAPAALDDDVTRLLTPPPARVDADDDEVTRVLPRGYRLPDEVLAALNAMAPAATAPQSAEPPAATAAVAAVAPPDPAAAAAAPAAEAADEPDFDDEMTRIVLPPAALAAAGGGAAQAEPPLRQAPDFDPTAGAGAAPAAEAGDQSAEPPAPAQPPAPLPEAAALPTPVPAPTPAPIVASTRPDTLWPAIAPSAAPGTLPGSSLTRHPATLPTGGGGDPQLQQVGRYLIKQRLGRGGMATVYRAHDPSIGRDVAIKFLHASLSEDDECRTRFLRESRAAGGLSHPNIVVIHDVGEIEKRPYMAMELIDGAPLSDTLDQRKSLPIRDAVVIALQLARALEYAHGRGIVHRDIKPGNIMLLRGSQTIKVADFGIAHMDDGRDDQRTQIGAVLGTPQYMSPEQARGEKLDGRSDLFSAGIVLYQMLAGERPFRGDSLVAVATRIANEQPPPVTAKRPEVPPSLRRVVERCLAKPPGQRYQSGKELAEALIKVLTEIDESARERDKPRIVPLRVKWALMMGVIVAVVMGLTATVITQRQYAAMMAQVSDYGASLARFIAAQNAASVLGDEWEAVDIAVQEIMKTGNFERVSVIDMQGNVRVSSQRALEGKPYRPEGTEALGKVGGGIAAVRYASGGESVLGFEAPVLFQGKQVGRVALGIPEQPLTQVARLSIMLMVVLAIVTVLAVAIAMYFVANWFAKPIRLVSDSMAEIGQGRFNHRIGEQRKDEFGLLFNAFDSMAQALQDRDSAGHPATPTLPPGTLGPATLLPGQMAAVPAGAAEPPAAGEPPQPAR
jgi:serine/threonine-protein kinase